MDSQRERGSRRRGDEDHRGWAASAVFRRMAGIKMKCGEKEREAEGRNEEEGVIEWAADSGLPLTPYGLSSLRSSACKQLNQNPALGFHWLKGILFQAHPEGVFQVCQQKDGHMFVLSFIYYGWVYVINMPFGYAMFCSL